MEMIFFIDVIAFITVVILQSDIFIIVFIFVVSQCELLPNTLCASTLGIFTTLRGLSHHKNRICQYYCVLAKEHPELII